MGPRFLERLWTPAHMNFCNELLTHYLAHNPESSEKICIPGSFKLIEKMMNVSKMFVLPLLFTRHISVKVVFCC